MDWVKNVLKILVYIIRQFILLLKEYNFFVLLFFKIVVNNRIKFKKIFIGDFKFVNCRIFYFRILQFFFIRVFEIYLGDGSVIVLQGVKGFYYKYFSFYGDRVDK